MSNLQTFNEMAASAPSVSILIPTHNRAHFVLNAVRSAISQTYGSVEVLVGVNGCTDNTDALVRGIDDPRLRVISHPKLVSMYENFNRLVREARGEFVLILSDDDVLHTDAIANLVQSMSRTGTRMAVGAVRVILYGRGETVPFVGIQGGHTDWFTLVLTHLRARMPVYPCATLLPRKELLDIGGYDEGEYRFAADTAVWVRLARQFGKVAICNEIVADYMVHDANETTTSNSDKWISALDSIGGLLSQLTYSAPNQRRENDEGF